MKRDSMAAMTTAETVASRIKNRVCSRQSANAASTVTLATIAIGKLRRPLTDAESLLTVDRTGLAHRAPARRRGYVRGNTAITVGGSDHGFDVRIARQKGSVAPVYRNGRAFSQCDGSEVFFESGRLDRPRDNSQEFAVRSGQSLRDDGCPPADDAAPHQFDLDRCRRGTRFEDVEIIADDNSERPGTGHTSDELINVPLASNTLMLAASE